MRVHLTSRTMLASLVVVGSMLFGAAAQDAVAQSRDGRDRRIELINDTSVDLVTFNASRVDVNTWQEDILGRRVLRPGERVTVNIDDGTSGCLYDLRAIFADKDVVTRRKFDVCSAGYWRIYNR